jgi:hypothetical protein
LNDSSAAEKGGSKGNGSSKDAAKDDKKEKKKKSKKKEEENGMPTIKKPLSAYMLFNNSRRPTLQGEYPCKSFQIISTCKVFRTWA